ncbi:hypothetical protein Amet_1723 [Alkaliphilus metalliredigens QYMF]|uniref:Uncharacterized protein n=1 Tax=Alkaliphilus metalliredigens (strain QYMF) TaxID=293826 RepID=A6TNY1_ALKMQ|nr:hypothetical protein [Alkaliphilus metalliredigens]ABR47899.1 hypothetical protein Amet_1723 [Alkaliphilus metalliredigens QYMF]
MELFQDIIHTNRPIIKKALLSLKKNWSIIFTGFFYSIATVLLMSVIRFFGLLAGIVMIVATSALISNYLYLLDCIMRKGKFTKHDFKEGFSVYLRKIWGILFVGYIANMVLSLFMPAFYRSGIIHPNAVSMIITFLTVLLFNAVPESAYQKHYNPWETITYGVEFIKDNWIEWFVPNVVLLGVFYLLTGQFLTGVFNYQISLVTIFTSPYGLLGYVVGQVWFSYMMIYRGFLFGLLSSSTRRKRLFMRDF